MDGVLFGEAVTDIDELRVLLRSALSRIGKHTGTTVSVNAYRAFSKSRIRLCWSPSCGRRVDNLVACKTYDMEKRMAERVRKTTASGGTGTRSKTTTGAAARKTARPPAQPRSREELGITEEQIRNRAYQIFLRRKGAPGDQFGDWVLAERELINEIGS